MSVSQETIQDWIKASLFLACSDGELAQSERHVIEALASEWSNEDQQVSFIIKQELSKLFGFSSPPSLECIFPNGISCPPELSHAFFVRLLAVKQADGIVDHRELDVAFDILELLPGAMALPPISIAREEARALLLGSRRLKEKPGQGL
jgi:hypothetical protein